MPRTYFVLIDGLPAALRLGVLRMPCVDYIVLLFYYFIIGGLRPAPGGITSITAAVCEDQISQRRYIVKAKAFIDTTGDGRLGAEAGAEWIQGREGKV